ncbi:hypothetical protein PL81_31770 [Streptomyces sp. RSD-27]|nr:hypothetical protein PL81_31770 [Streptomyces sp. RSD-27]
MIPEAVLGHLCELGGEQTRAEDGGEAVNGVFALFALAAGEGGQQLGQRVGWTLHGRVPSGAGAMHVGVAGWWREGFPDGVAVVGDGCLGQPAEVVETVVAC